LNLSAFLILIKMNRNRILLFPLIMKFTYIINAQIGKYYGFGQHPENLQSLAQLISPTDDYNPRACGDIPKCRLSLCRKNDILECALVALYPLISIFCVFLREISLT
jgi:hypothetical protein